MSKKTIVSIDDDVVITKIITRALEENGFDFIAFNDPKEGSKYVLEHGEKGEIDGIVLDQVMPGMSGDEILDMLSGNSKTKDIPVLMLTSQNNVEDITASLNLGAKDYVVKPFDTDNFILRLNKILEIE